MDREEFEKQLRGLPNDVVNAFAVRCALRVLPLLAQQQPGVEQHTAFWFWKVEDRARHLLGVMRCLNIGLIRTINNEILTHVTDADYAAGDAAASTADYADYARGAAYAAAARGNIAASTAYATAATAKQHYITKELENDLFFIKKNTPAVATLLQRPFWSGVAPANWQALLGSFKTDVLSLNAGFEYWLDWYDDRCNDQPIDIKLSMQSIQIPEAIQDQGVPHINAYLANLRNKSAVKPLNRVRAIFIGYGDSGKTSVIRVLHGEAVKEAEPMTPGIEIREWPVPNTDIKAHFWDFGGQVMVHATHQLFLRESCLYVLVISSRNEINATEQAEYWLEHVKTFGKNAPVIIVGNKTDQTPLNLEMATLREKYPNIVNFFPIACTQAQDKFKLQFDLFSQEFCQQLQAVGTHQMMFTAAQAKVLDSLRQLQSNKTFLSQVEYLALCSEHGVGEDGIQNREWLLDILDKLGVIIHFPELPFADGYVLNPRWLTYGVYKLMYSAQSRLSQKDIVQILGSEKVVNEVGQGLAYPPDKCFLIMEAMKQFKLCYSLPGQTDTLIIPALLAPDAPRFKFDKSPALAFSFVFKGFLPRHVLPELIVIRHENIMRHGEQSYVWQHGVCLESKGLRARAILQVDYHLRTLSIWAIGSDARDYLMLLRNDIKEILSRLTISPDEMITLPASTRITQGQLPMGRDDEQADFQQIQAVERLGRNEYISASGSIYDVSKILQRFIPDSARIQHHTVNHSIHIHGSTIHGNVINAEIIQDSFNQLAASPASEEVKQQLKILLQEIQSLHAKVPAAQKPIVNDMLADTQALITETARPEPRPKRIGISLDGILEAGQKVGSIAQTVLAAANALSPLLPG